MELQNGAIIFVIILLSFVLISYAVYLIYTENLILKNKVNEVFTNMNNMETNLNNIFSGTIQPNLPIQQDVHEHGDELSEEDIGEDIETDTEFESDEEFDEIYSSGCNEPLPYIEEIETELETELETQPQTEIEPLTISLGSDSFVSCSKILTHGKRKGQTCDKKVVGDDLYCKLHNA